MSKTRYAIVTVPAAPVRKLANHRSEMSNQLLFGEALKIIKQKDDTWFKVESLYDGYIGWLTYHLITMVDEHTAKLPATLLAPGMLNKITFGNCTMHIPLGSSLIHFKNKKGNIGRAEYSFNGKPLNTSLTDNKEQVLINNAMQWLNAPYLWGGKTILGVDCSGFSQTMYKLIGMPIARDAWQQALQGKKVSSLAKAQPGDLAFFDDKDEIVHVGILLGPDRIIHSAGKVRIDHIDRKGITNTETGKRTHTLKLVRRFF